MRKQGFSWLFGALSLLPFGFAKTKRKVVLPNYILKAKTVSVLIDPNSGTDLTDTQANRTAQKDVETALLKWGRFEPLIDSATAELLIVVRRGNGKVVNATLPAPQQNRRPGVISGTDTDILVGGQRGSQPNSPNQPDTSVPGRSHPQIEVADPNDAFLVYEGQQSDALDSNPGWRYVAKDGLHSHNVPAVDAFRQAIEDAERAADKP